MTTDNTSSGADAVRAAANTTADQLVKTPAPAAPSAKKLELTEEELAARIAAASEAALKAEREAAAKKAAKEKDEAERKKAEEAGEFKKLADDERTRREEAERARDAALLDSKRAAVEKQIAAHVREHHKDHAGVNVEKWILPHVPFDLTTTDDTLGKRIKEAVADYVKDHQPASPLSGAPSGSVRGKLPAGTAAPAARDTNGEGNGAPVMLQGPTRRF